MWYLHSCQVHGWIQIPWFAWTYPQHSTRQKHLHSPKLNMNRCCFIFRGRSALSWEAADWLTSYRTFNFFKGQSWACILLHWRFLALNLCSTREWTTFMGKNVYRVKLVKPNFKHKMSVCNVKGAPCMTKPQRIITWLWHLWNNKKNHSVITAATVLIHSLQCFKKALMNQLFSYSLSNKWQTVKVKVELVNIVEHLAAK